MAEFWLRPLLQNRRCAHRRLIPARDSGGFRRGGVCTDGISRIMPQLDGAVFRLACGCLDHHKKKAGFFRPLVQLCSTFFADDYFQSARSARQAFTRQRPAAAPWQTSRRFAAV
jgi:hypothetical protein